MASMRSGKGWQLGLERLMITGDVWSSTKEEIAILELKKNMKMVMIIMK